MIDKYRYPEFHLHHYTGTSLPWCHTILCNIQWKAQLCMCNLDLGNGIFQRIFTPKTQAQILTLWCGCYKLLLSLIFGVIGWNVKQHHLHLFCNRKVTFFSRIMFTDMVYVLLNTPSKMFNLSGMIARTVFGWTCDRTE